MNGLKPLAWAAALAMGCALGTSHAADEDALDLEAKPAPAAAKPAAAASATARGSGSVRWELEAAALHGSRWGGGSDSGHRVALGLRLEQPLGASGWRAHLSNRFDHTDPAPLGQKRARNQLREAYLGWQDAQGGWNLEVGRINLRHGPAFGYNPTDVFREGATPRISNADPVALRANRLGTFMLRGGRLLDNGSLSLALAPRLTRNAPVEKTWSVDEAYTNGVNKLAAAWGHRWSSRLNSELVIARIDRDNLIGLSGSALLGDAVVAHAEVASRQSARLLDALTTLNPNRRWNGQAALGLTWTAASGLDLTAEVLFNQAGLNRSEWGMLNAAAPGAYQLAAWNALASQDLLSRSGLQLMARYKDVAGLQGLDAASFWRRNLDDRSHLTWLELRYRWGQVEAALQWQRASGLGLSQYGAMPYRDALQLIGVTHF